MKNSLPNIFAYIDFKQYLKDYREMKKKSDPGFSNQYICHRLGQRSSKSYFNNIVSGRKTLTSEFTDRLLDLLELGPDEASYFRALVNYNQTMSPKEKEYHFDQVVSLNSTPKKFIDKNTYAYFTEWYHASIRELLDIYDFDGDYKKLANRLEPSVSHKEATRSVKLLKKLGLVKTNKAGFLKPTNKVISTGDNVRDAIIEQYQVKCFERAKEKIVSSPKRHRTIVTTLSVSSNGLERILRKMNQYQSEIRSIAHKEEESDKKVYELIIHAHSQSN